MLRELEFVPADVAIVTFVDPIFGAPNEVNWLSA